MYSGTFQPKNPTTARKPGNDMKKNASLPKMGDSPAANQRDKGLGFNGQDNGSSQRASTNKVQTNHYTGRMNEGADVQFGQMPVKKGYHGARTAGPVTAAGAGVTGRRDFAPKAGQNYNGNPDKIQMKQMPNRKGNMC